MANNMNVAQIMQMLNGGTNPQQILQNFMRSNPQMAQTQTQLVNMQKSSGMSGKEFVMQYAKQNGIDTKQIEDLGNKLGLK